MSCSETTTAVNHLYTETESTGGDRRSVKMKMNEPFRFSQVKVGSKAKANYLLVVVDLFLKENLDGSIVISDAKLMKMGNFGQERVRDHVRSLGCSLQNALFSLAFRC